MRSKLLLSFFTIILFSISLQGQDFYRLEANFSIKEKLEEEGSQLITGTLYYDKYIKKVVYDVQFPDPRTYVMADTILFTIKDGAVIETKTIPQLSEYSFFHMLLEQSLNDFGLSNPKSGFTLEDVERDEGRVISTYKPLEQMQEVFGNILISQVKTNLRGVVIMGPDENLMNKQIFRNYKNVKGLNVPTEIIYFNYLEDGRTHKKITTFKNVKLNETSNDNMYNYPVGSY